MFSFLYHFWISDIHCKIERGWTMGRKLTQRLFAKTACFTACKKVSTGRLGILIRSAPVFNLMAFSSGRNNSMVSSAVLYAFRPSNNPCQHPSIITFETVAFFKLQLQFIYNLACQNNNPQILARFNDAMAMAETEAHMSPLPSFMRGFEQTAP
jgi:hypothetical protein